jgi:diguanylate cyclase
MIDLFQFALNSIDIGIIIIDGNQCIKFWNRYMERISEIKHNDAVGKRLGDVCETFQKRRYQEIFESVFVQNMSRFCSSKLHKAFVFPASGNRDNIRQNMKIEPTTLNDECYALIQIDDITDEVSNEFKLTSLINELKRGYLEVKESEELNRQLAEMDPLTKIANRHGITQYLNKLFENKAELHNHALMFLDLDGFKSVNDTYGHLMGDNLLIEIAGILKRKVRKDDVVARLGGDEFLVLLSNIESTDAVKTVGKKLVEEIAKPIVFDGVTISVTISIGIVMYDAAIKDTSDFIKLADEAMYMAKNHGKNKFVLYKDT